MTSLLTRVLSFGSTASTGSRFDDEVYRRDFISDLREHTITLAEDIWRSFWEPDVDLFCNKRPSAETVGLLSLLKLLVRFLANWAVDLGAAGHV